MSRSSIVRRRRESVNGSVYRNLCYATWCGLDLEKWGGELERSTTIAPGSGSLRIQVEDPAHPGGVNPIP